MKLVLKVVDSSEDADAHAQQGQGQTKSAQVGSHAGIVERSRLDRKPSLARHSCARRRSRTAMIGRIPRGRPPVRAALGRTLNLASTSPRPARLRRDSMPLYWNSPCIARLVLRSSASRSLCPRATAAVDRPPPPPSTAASSRSTPADPVMAIPAMVIPAMAIRAMATRATVIRATAILVMATAIPARSSSISIRCPTLAARACWARSSPRPASRPTLARARSAACSMVPTSIRTTQPRTSSLRSPSPTCSWTTPPRSGSRPRVAAIG